MRGVVLRVFSQRTPRLAIRRPASGIFVAVLRSLPARLLCAPPGPDACEHAFHSGEGGLDSKFKRVVSLRIQGALLFRSFRGMQSLVRRVWTRESGLPHLR